MLKYLNLQNVLMDVVQSIQRVVYLTFCNMPAGCTQNASPLVLYYFFVLIFNVNNVVRSEAPNFNLTEEALKGNEKE